MKSKQILLALLCLLLLWQLAAMLVDQPILPTPLEVGISFTSEITKDLGTHFLASFWRVSISMLLSIARMIASTLLGDARSAGNLAHRGVCAQ